MRGLWVAKGNNFIVVFASVDNELLRKPPLLICQTLGRNADIFSG